MPTNKNLVVNKGDEKVSFRDGVKKLVDEMNKDIPTQYNSDDFYKLLVEMNETLHFINDRLEEIRDEVKSG